MPLASTTSSTVQGICEPRVDSQFCASESRFTWVVFGSSAGARSALMVGGNAPQTWRLVPLVSNALVCLRWRNTMTIKKVNGLWLVDAHGHRRWGRCRASGQRRTSPERHRRHPGNTHRRSQFRRQQRCTDLCLVPDHQACRQHRYARRSNHGRAHLHCGPRGQLCRLSRGQRRHRVFHSRIKVGIRTSTLSGITMTTPGRDGRRRAAIRFGLRPTRLAARRKTYTT